MNWERRTFGVDLIRSVPAGGLETLSATFAVFLAVAIFQAGPWAKAILVASGSIGLMLSLFVVQFIRRTGWSLNHTASFIWAISATAFLVAALGQGSLVIYVAGVTVGQTTIMMSVPLFSHIYRKHYPGKIRGRLFATAGVVRKIGAITVGLLFGWWLDRNLADYRWLLMTYAGCCLAMIACVQFIRPVHLSRSNEVKLFEAFRHVREDRDFRQLLISWMILGIGNLICFSLFVEYIANPVYGFELGAAEASWLTTFTPEAVYLLTVVAWGVVFDRFNFFAVRVVINVFFIVGVLVFYLGPEIWMLYLGIALHGVGKAGGNVAWSLWVTKFAKAENVAEYMSVHTFLTGCRGVVAPLISFQMAANLSPQLVGVLGAGLMTIASFMIGPQLRSSLRKESAQV